MLAVKSRVFSESAKNTEKKLFDFFAPFLRICLISLLLGK